MNLTSKQRTIFEIIVVLSTMLLVKDIADRFNVIGAGSIAMWSGIFAATFFMKKQSISWKDRGLGLPNNVKDWLKSIGLALLVVVLVIAFMAIVPIVASAFGFSIPESSTDRFEFMLGNTVYFAAYLLIVIWIGAAVGEELLMRGFLLNNLMSLFGQSKIGVVAAVVFHAIIFGMLHISQGIPGIIGTGGVAIIFAIMYLLNSRKLFPLIIAHGLINSISLTAYFLSDGKIT
ncbi:MAG: CPBP family intramembrane metalloprotease [Thalassotalea sp.]|nr:CPBP family intramembrane metalloprotease [Thalassotalea sp.]